MRSPETVQYINEHGRNPNYLGFLQLRKENIFPTDVLEEAVRFSDHVLFAVPSAFLAAAISELKPEHMTGKSLVTSIKGIVPGHNQIPSDFLGKQLGVPPERHVVIGGPCHAEEIAMQRKTYVTVAADEASLAARVAASIDLPYVTTVISEDPVGIELGAILKNVIGIACGIAHGLNYGDNFQAVLVSNAMREMSSFIRGLDGKDRDFSRSGYFGDLLVTAYSEYSRNRTFGQMIGRGYSVHLAQSEMNMVAEGYYAAEGIYRMARRIGQDMPIASAVYRILYNKISPYVEFKLLEQKLI